METRYEENKLILDINDDLVASKVKNIVDESRKYIDLKEKYEEIILNLESVKIIDSIGISFIIGLFRTAKDYERKFKIVGINDDIGHLFSIIKFDEVMDIEIS